MRLRLTLGLLLEALKPILIVDLLKSASLATRAIGLVVNIY